MPLDSFSYTGANSYFWTFAQGPISNGMRNVTQVCSVPINSKPSLFTRLAVMRNNAMVVGSPLDSVRLFDSVSGVAGSTAESNSVVLNGFAGSIPVSVSGGAHLLVNGVDVGTTANVAAGSTVRLRATSPAGTASASYTLTVGNSSTTWNVTTRPLPAQAGIAGTPSGYSPVSASVEGGGASIAIPITVPPAAGGMEPKLAISYSSQGGNGFMGMGFGISGLSAITRTGAVQYLDGIKSGVSFGPNDRFAVDGQRLVLINGVWGGNGAEYRTQSESFSQVTSQGSTTNGPLSWIVKTKAGLTYEYGTSVDSRILADRASVPGDTAVLMWALTRITDNTGNTIEFFYEGTDASDHGAPLIASISYGKNTAAGEQSVRPGVVRLRAPLRRSHQLRRWRQNRRQSDHYGNSLRLRRQYRPQLCVHLSAGGDLGEFAIDPGRRVRQAAGRRRRRTGFSADHLHLAAKCGGQDDNDDQRANGLARPNGVCTQ